MRTVDTDNSLVCGVQPSPGEFPFPIVAGNQESRHITRLRDFSSYLTVGGLRNALDAIAAYSRGVLGNVLILLPVLLLIGCGLGLSHFFVLWNPLVISKYLLIGLAACVLLFFVLDCASFNGQWLKLLPSITMVLLLLSLLIECSPIFIEWFRKNPWVQQFGLKECLATIFSLAGVASALARFVPRSGRVRMTLFAVAMSILSLTLVWVVVLAVANYIAYGVPPNNLSLAIPWILGVFIAVCSLTYLFFVRHPSLIQFICRVVMHACIVCIALFSAYLLTYRIREMSLKSSRAVGTITRPLSRLTDALKASKPLLSSDLFSAVNSVAQRKEPLDRQADVAGSLQWGSAGEFFRTLNPSYYQNAVIFMEHAGTIGVMEPVDRERILKALVTIGREKLNSLHPRDSQTSQDVLARRNEGVELEQMVLSCLVDTFVSERAKVNVQNTDLASAEIAYAELEKLVETEALRNWLIEQRASSSVSHEYLQLVGRDKESEKWSDVSSPDAALNGPSLISRELIETKLREVREVSLLRNLSLSDPRLSGETLALIGKGLTLEQIKKICVEKSVSVLSFETLVEVCLFDELHVNAMGIRRFCNFKASETAAESAKEFIQTVAASYSCSPREVKEIARIRLASMAVQSGIEAELVEARGRAAYVLAELFHPQVPIVDELVGTPDERSTEAYAIYRRLEGKNFTKDELCRILAWSFVPGKKQQAENLVRQIAVGPYGNLDSIENVGFLLFKRSWIPKCLLTLWVVCWIFIYCYLYVDPNATAIHGFYRDRLAAAFLHQSRPGNQVAAAAGVPLSQLCRYEEGGCIAPYHLINVALNMQKTQRTDIRDRYADFFIFSKLYVGGEATGYLPTTILESVMPRFTAASAMAISAGAASPNMGKYTNGLLTFFLTLVNLRLGFWIPNPIFLWHRNRTGEIANENAILDFEAVFREERKQLALRRANVCECGQTASPPPIDVDSHYFGLAISGGGIRSAALNLGICQYLHLRGIFKYFDYMSTVSGGGYLGTGISVFMRAVESAERDAESASTHSDSNGNTDVVRSDQVRRTHRKPPFWLLYQEMTSYLSERSEWINLTDGGHVENLGAYQLLKRRCEVIVIGDGEADPDGKFDGLAHLCRLAEIDLGVRIEFHAAALGELTPGIAKGAIGPRFSKSHFTVGKIHYPPNPQMCVGADTGYVLYLKSTITEDADVVTRSYGMFNSAFPHESTADQFFNEGQFEAYRRLGLKIASTAIQTMEERYSPLRSNKMQLRAWLEQQFHEGH